MLILFRDREEMAKALIDAGANVNAQNNKGHTPLIIAAYKGQYGVLRLLATNAKIQIDMQVRKYVVRMHIRM